MENPDAFDLDALFASGGLEAVLGDSTTIDRAQGYYARREAENAKEQVDAIMRLVGFERSELDDALSTWARRGNPTTSEYSRRLHEFAERMNEKIRAGGLTGNAVEEAALEVLRHE